MRFQKGGKLYQAVKHIVCNRKGTTESKHNYVQNVLHAYCTVWGRMLENDGMMGLECRLVRWNFLEWLKANLEEIVYLRVPKNRNMRERVEKSRLCWYGNVKRIGKEKLPRMMEEMGGWKKTMRTAKRKMERRSRSQSEKKRAAVKEEKWWKDQTRWRGFLMPRHVRKLKRDSDMHVCITGISEILIYVIYLSNKNIF